MPEYIYIKADAASPNPSKEKIKQLKKTLYRFLPNLLIFFGIAAVGSVFYPLFSYYQNTKRWQDQSSVASATIAHQQPQATQGPIIIENIDYTKIENWFTQPINLDHQQNQLQAKDLSIYSISIPRFNVVDMKVTVGGESLDQTLIHYEGTAMPGQLGNPVIFGHSVLPVFYNPKSYMSVFTMIPNLEKDDEIFITYDNITYRYLVQSYHEIQPDQVEVLAQRYDRRTLTLITCVPQGTYLRRGVILAQLAEYE